MASCNGGCESCSPKLRPSHLRLTTWILGYIFGHGLLISWRKRWEGLIIYLVMWAVSYVVLYKKACSRCANYGKRCPVPLEGSLVAKFVKPSEEVFSISCIVWASVAYFLRILVPLAILPLRITLENMAFWGAFGLYWVNHALYEGCPICENETCPLNPEQMLKFRKR